MTMTLPVASAGSVTKLAPSESSILSSAMITVPSAGRYQGLLPAVELVVTGDPCDAMLTVPALPYTDSIDPSRHHLKPPHFPPGDNRLTLSKYQV